MDVTTFAITAAIVTGGAAITGMAGFGFIIASMPFMVMLYPPKTAVALVLTVAFMGVLLQWVRVRRHVHYPLAARLSVGGLLGVPLGSLVLVTIEPSFLKLLIGTTVLAAAAVNLMRREGDAADQPSRMPGTAMTLAAGFTGGVMAASVGQSGAPVALLLNGARLDKAVVRATMVTFFAVVDLASLAAMWQNGILTRAIGVTGLTLMPFYLAGLLLGDRAFERVSQASYRRVILAVVSVAAVMGLVSGLSALV